MHARCLMGDYSFGISSNVTALSSVDYQQSKNGGKSFYGDPHTIPEELLMDKTNQSGADKQSEAQQQQSPNGKDLSNGDGNMDEFTNCKSKGEDIDLSSNNQMEKHMIETSPTSGTPSSNLQLEFPDAVITTSAPSFWAGVTGEDQFNPCVPPPMKNPLSFQNFPNSPNPMFNSSLGPQINIPQSLPQQQRRAITGAHNFSQQSRHQQPQSNILKTFSNWTNPQNPSWSAPQTPNEMLPPWNAMNLTNQKRTVPNMNPVCPQKKNSVIGQHPMVMSPSKFRRSTSLPLNKQYPHSFGGNPPFDMSTLEENREGNMMFPFQASNFFIFLK